jgi:transcriptional regulator with XRE-family HTH domain
MEMKVNANLIRSERENRGWSQEHLGNVAGLSLRTVQRIEKTGSASFESVTALAAVLTLDVADLRVTESEPARARALRLSLELPLRLALACVSGLLCALHFRWRAFHESYGIDFEWFDYGIAGALFGAAVLCPYLRSGQGMVLRAIGLIGGSALSYYCAMNVAAFAGGFTFLALLLASFTGVAIVLAAAKFLIPLRVTAAFWVLGFVASLVGGAAMYAGFEVFGDTNLSRIVGYCVWHMATCMAIYHGRQSNDAQSGLLADFAKARARFSIVPGWLKLSHPLPG